MKIWPALIVVGVAGFVLGVTLILLNQHHTIGLGGIGLGVVLIAIGSGLLLQERGAKTKQDRNWGPSNPKLTLRAPGVRALAAIGIIVLVGASAFYASIYLVSVQGPSQTFTGPRSTLTGSQSSQTSTSGTTSTTSSTSGSRTSAIIALKMTLYAGTPTNGTSRGTASLYMVLQNTGDSTTITSIVILRPPNVRQPPIYQCRGPSSCALISVPYVNARSTSAFNTTSTGFYIGSTLLPQTLYGYEVYFANGATLFGTLNAT